MLVTWLGHAQLFLNAAEKTVLMDPWFVEPVFGGAWFRYPPAPYPNASTLPRPDFLMLSHTHPDHSGPATLAQLSNQTRTLAMKFPSGALKRRLDQLGFSHVTWFDPWETMEVAPGLKVTFVPNHNGWEVSSMIVEAGGVRVYHGNDNPLSVERYREIAQRVGPINLAFLPYAGASSFPTGFDGDPKTLQARCDQKKAEGLARFTDALEGLRPDEAAPFASSWALLEARELWKNLVDRPTSEECLHHSMPFAVKSGTHLLHLEPGDEWSHETGVIRKGLTTGWTNDADAVTRYATQERARVDAAIAAARGVGETVDPPQLDLAVRTYLQGVVDATRAGTAGLTMKAGFTAKAGQSWHIEFVAGKAPVISNDLAGDEDETLTLLPNELWSIVNGRTTWEDVWYGYRLKVKKREGAGYFRAFWEMLLNFDDAALTQRVAALSQSKT